MIKPRKLNRGDRIAIVSLSWGGLGDPATIHKYRIAKGRLEHDFGLEVTAVFSAIGGDDSIRILPYVDLDVIRDNPKIFMGYSDTTISHLIMHKAGLCSFYGPSVMCEFGEYVKMFDYTRRAVEDILFGTWEEYELLPSPEWTDDYITWQESNIHVSHKMKKDTHGYEVLNGSGTARGRLLGGCIDVFMMAVGTSVWPALDEWKDAILFFETSEEKPSPEYIVYMLRNLAAQGILNMINGIIVGKPKDEAYYEEYKEAILRVVLLEEHLDGLPVIYNVNIGHAKPIGILPYGIETELDCDNKRIRFLESPTV